MLCWCGGGGVGGGVHFLLPDVIRKTLLRFAAAERQLVSLRAEMVEQQQSPKATPAEDLSLSCALSYTIPLEGL